MAAPATPLSIPSKKTPQRIAFFDQATGQQVTGEIMEIGPDEARTMLAANPMNRNPSTPTVDAYCRAMINGEWQFIGDPIRLNDDGEILDGQQRLMAVKDSGTTQTFLVIRGLLSDSRLVMDQGRPRTARDNLKMQDVAAYADKATIAALLLRWEMGSMGNNHVKLQNNEVYEFVMANNDLLGRAVNQAKVLRREISMAKGAAGATFFRAHKIHVFAAAHFFDHLATGMGLDAGDPILTLRGTIIRNKAIKGSGTRRIASAEELYYIVRAWNAFCRGELLQKLQLPATGVALGAEHFRLTEPLPEVIARLEEEARVRRASRPSRA